MRIAFISLSSELGGGEALLRDLAIGLGRRGEEIAVFGRCKKLIDDLRAANVECVLCSSNHYRVLNLRSNLKHFCHRFKPDIVHYNEPRGMYLHQRQAGVLPVVTMHCVPSLIHGPRRWLRDQVFRCGSKKMDTCFCISQNVKMELDSLELYCSLKVMNSGVDMVRFAYCDYANAVVGEVLLVGRMVEGKGHRDLILAAKGVTGVRLIFVGEGKRSFLRSLKLLADKNGVEVDFRGFSSAPESYYRKAAVVALPSRSEGLPLSILEGMAIGRPILSYRFAGADEVVREGETGFLVNRGDIEGLSHKMRVLIGDQKLAAGMGRSGHLLICEKYSLNLMIDKYLEAYREILTRKTKS